MVHVRQLEDTTLTFIVSGKLWRNSLIMMDKETGSLWSHITGECMEGEYLDRTLTQIPSVQTTWSEWVTAHPGTRVLKKSEEILSSKYERYFADPERTGLFRTMWLQDRMPGKALIHGLTIGPHALAVADSVLTVDQPVTTELAEIQLKVVREPDGGVSATRADTGEAVLVRTAFWFAWSSFYPNTEVLD